MISRGTQESGITIEITRIQGWEFAHLISERIARFLSKNEQFAHIAHFL